MVSREMRFVLVKLRGDGDCFVAASSFSFLLYCPYQWSPRWSLKEAISLFSLPLFQRQLLLLGTLREFGMWENSTHLYFLDRLNL